MALSEKRKRWGLLIRDSLVLLLANPDGMRLADMARALGVHPVYVGRLVHGPLAPLLDLKVVRGESDRDGAVLAKLQPRFRGQEPLQLVELVLRYRKMKNATVF
jgi:hypothetical protein